MNAQDLFDIVVTHLYTQGRRAINEGGGCVYRTEGGLACAVGCLIEDDHPGAAYKGYVTGLLAKYGDQLPAWMKEYEPLLIRLQIAHDSTDEEYDDPLEDRLRSAARDFDLAYRAEFYPQPPTEWR